MIVIPPSTQGAQESLDLAREVLTTLIFAPKLEEKDFTLTVNDNHISLTHNTDGIRLPDRIIKELYKQGIEVSGDNLSSKWKYKISRA